MLDLPDLDDRRSGALVTLYRYLGDHLKVGLGYNFTALLSFRSVPREASAHFAMAARTEVGIVTPPPTSDNRCCGLSGDDAVRSRPPSTTESASGTARRMSVTMLDFPPTSS